MNLRRALSKPSGRGHHACCLAPTSLSEGASRASRPNAGAAPVGSGRPRGILRIVTLARIPRTSCGLLGLFVIIIVAEHALQPDLTPGSHRVSEYATGSPGWLMTVGFAAWTLALVATALVVTRSSLQPSWLRVVLGSLVAVAAAGAAVTAAFETGTRAGVVPVGRDLTVENRLHDVGSGAAGLALWIAAFISLLLADRRLRSQVAMLLGVGIVVAVALSDTLLDLPGVRQRGLLVVACVWQGLLLAAAARAS